MSSRRRVLRTIGAIGVATFSVPGGVGTVGAQSTYGLRQGDDCRRLTPILSDLPVDEFYHYGVAETNWSGSGPIESFEAPKTSRLFLYEGPEGLSLVLVHGKLQEERIRELDPVDGGSVSFAIGGLPEDGEWVVRDDFYEGPTQYDRWRLDAEPAVIHWTWTSGRTDGAVFRGVDGARFAIDPAFNDDAELHEQHYPGDVERWQAVTGSLDDPEFVTLDMDERLVLQPGGC